MVKNINKSIMIIVAVLLTLVLISTSTVSGIFAKYVVTKSATTEVSLKKFGIKLTLKPGANFESTQMSMDPSTLDDSTMSVTIDKLYLAPNEGFNEIVKFEIARDTRVEEYPVNVRLKVKATQVILTNCSIDGVTYVPIKFYANMNGGTTTPIRDAWKYGNSDNFENELAGDLTDGIKSLIGADTNLDSDGYAIKKIANKGTSNAPSITSIGFGFFCPPESADVGTNVDSDVIMTKLAEQDAKVQVTYTVSLEQIV